MSRDAIFSKIRSALADLPEKKALPSWDDEQIISAKRCGTAGDFEAFRMNFQAVNGRVIETIADLVALFRDQNCLHGYCDPTLMPQVGEPLIAAGCQVETQYDRQRFDAYQFGITQASGAIAESGSLILDDTRTSDRLAALSPWIHVAVLDRTQIHPHIPAALQALGPSRNIIWATGPSKTADVEGILIEGVHGPGEQVALVLND